MPELNIELIRSICNDLQSVTEGIKWGNDLCFMISGKMFCVVSLETPVKVSLKVQDEEFETLIAEPGMIPAPYVGRYKWILVEDINVFSYEKWRHYIAQSYNLVKAKLKGKKAS